MKLEIGQEYIDWINHVEALHEQPPLTEEQLTEYVNDVLDNHKRSWEDLQDQ